MKTIKNTEFGGERPLFGAYGLRLENVTFLAGESALKETSDILAIDCRFEGKYPFWHTVGFAIENCLFTEGARAALWYSEDVNMRDTLVEAPKMFREMKGIKLHNVKIPNALETLWSCRNINIDNVEVDNADYLFMHCADIKISNYRHNGNYSFQYCKNLVIRDAVINSKDAFWNTEDVTVYDSEINGEYLGWYSKNLRLVNCRISGTQPLCYVQNLKMENCVMAEDCDLAFEDTSLDADIKGHVTSVKNPRTGFITATSIGEIIIDEHLRTPGNCKIITEK